LFANPDVMATMIAVGSLLKNLAEATREAQDTVGLSTLIPKELLAGCAVSLFLNKLLGESKCQTCRWPLRSG
jgi:hypothetical protein